MKRIIFHLMVAVLALLSGVACSSLWLGYSRIYTKPINLDTTTSQRSSVAITSATPQTLPQGKEQEVQHTLITQNGELKIIRERETGNYLVQFNGRTILTEEATPLLEIYLDRTSPSEDIVLLTKALGDSCTVSFRILQLEYDGKYSMTEEFGNCDPEPAITINDQRLTFRFQSYYSHPNGYTSPETWVYKQGYYEYSSGSTSAGIYKPGELSEVKALKRKR